MMNSAITFNVNVFAHHPMNVLKDFIGTPEPAIARQNTAIVQLCTTIVQLQTNVNAFHNSVLLTKTGTVSIADAKIKLVHATTPTNSLITRIRNAVVSIKNQMWASISICRLAR